MADPFSIATGTIGIVAVAAQSTAALWRDITLIKDAPKALLDLESDLSAVERVLSTLQLESNAYLLETLMPEVQDGVKLARLRWVNGKQSLGKTCRSTYSCSWILILAHDRLLGHS